VTEEYIAEIVNKVEDGERVQALDGEQAILSHRSVIDEIRIWVT
jgi:hypothetical protein